MAQFPKVANHLVLLSFSWDHTLGRHFEVVLAAYSFESWVLAWERVAVKKPVGPHGPYECLVDRYPRWNADKIFADYMGKIFVHFVSDSFFILKEQLFPLTYTPNNKAHKQFKAVLCQETSIQLIPQTSEKEQLPATQVGPGSGLILRDLRRFL